MNGYDRRLRDLESRTLPLFSDDNERRLIEAFKRLPEAQRFAIRFESHHIGRVVERTGRDNYSRARSDAFLAAIAQVDDAELTEIVRANGENSVAWFERHLDELCDRPDLAGET